MSVNDDRCIHFDDELSNEYGKKNPTSTIAVDEIQTPSDKTNPSTFSTIAEENCVYSDDNLFMYHDSPITDTMFKVVSIVSSIIINYSNIPF